MASVYFLLNPSIAKFWPFFYYAHGSDPTHSLDLLLVKPVDEDPEIGGDAVLAVVHVGQGALGVHRLAGEHFPVLEAAQNLLHRGLSTRLENGGALGVLLFQVFESSLQK